MSTEPLTGLAGNAHTERLLWDFVNAIRHSDAQPGYVNINTQKVIEEYAKKWTALEQEAELRGYKKGAEYTLNTLKAKLQVQREDNHES